MSARDRLYRLMFSWFSLVPPGKWRVNTQIRRKTLRATFFQVQYSVIIPSFEATKFPIPSTYRRTYKASLLSCLSTAAATGSPSKCRLYMRQSYRTRGHNKRDTLWIENKELLPCHLRCLFVFLALQPIVVVFSQPGSGL
jgi:hypothetical protein